MVYKVNYYQLCQNYTNLNITAIVTSGFPSLSDYNCAFL